MSRERVQLRPLSFYENALKVVNVSVATVVRASLLGTVHGAQCMVHSARRRIALPHWIA